ncbi:MAG: AraC family transcriptional regulator [Ruminococcaceae bacterium]|nr:AraC family transcriptional regulator [Oscillospiraceae bacterium]
MLDILPYLKVYTFIRTSYIPTGKKVSSETVNQHWHSYCQLVYVRRGTGSVIIDGSFFPVSEGDVVIIRRNEPHSFAIFEEKLETYELKFDIVSSEEDFINDGPRLFCRDSDGAIRRAIKQIEQESDATDALSTKIIALELCKIILLMRRISSNPQAEPAAELAETDSKKDALLNKIDAYIQANLHKNFTIRDMSSDLYMEYSYLSRLFSAKYGVRLKQYINQKRLVNAKELITGTDMTMTEIAAKCGFGTLYRLERIFKAEVGISPSEFRNDFNHKYHVTFEANPETHFQFEDPKGGNINGKHSQDNPCV